MRLPATQDLSDGELFWIIENGVRLTGTPAWGVPCSGDDSWKLVHFIRHLPALSRQEMVISARHHVAEGASMHTKLMAAAAALFIGTIALAHGSAEHTKGNVKSVAPDAIVVSTAHGEQSFLVTERTAVVKDGAASAIGDLHAGDRVVVHATQGSPREAERIVASGEKGRSGKR
jgi:hypothetical protein